MQKITRTNLKQIYDVVCQGWQGKINEALKAQAFSSDIDVEDDVLTTAFNQADPDQKKLLKKFFKFPESIFDKIKNIADVYTHLKITRKLPYPKPANKLEKYLNACYDIPHITQAYNDVIVLNWKNKNQKKFYLWWQKNASGSWVLYGVGGHFYSACAGFGCYFATEEGANDAASKFKSIFIDHLPE